MPKKAPELGPLAVSRLTKPGLHFVGGVAGLALQVLESGGRSWILRATVGTKRRDMGLGGYPDVALAKAREAAAEARAKIRQGVDPIQEVQAAREVLRLSQANAVPFKRAALAYIETHELGWRNAKHAQQWRNSLETYAYPLIGDTLVGDIELPHVLKVLEPIWRTKTETATRVRGRIEKVLDWATTRGYRKGLNPARWRGHLDNLLPAPNKIAKEEHHAALPVGEVGAFVEKLRTHSGMGALALEFGILTAARSGEVRGARWSEIDLSERVWTVPGNRMKAGREHRVPLSDAAMTLLNKIREGLNFPDGEEPPADWLVFVAPRGGILSDGTLNAVIRRMGLDVVQHGFRSTFRDWASERTNYPNDVAEMALAHTIPSKVEAAYRRGDLFEKRRRLMADWADFLTKLEKPAQVIELKSKRA
jgi:integrase